MKLTDWFDAKKGLAVATLAGFLHAISSSAAMAEETLRSLMAFPPSDNTAQLYVELVALLNERGKGVVQVKILGGPEVVPGFQQTDAVARGVVDMTYAPVTYSLGVFPEGGAWVGSNIPPAESRTNGGFDLVQSIAAERLGVQIVARFAPGAPFALYLVDEPPMNEDGTLNLEGLRLRASPLFNAFYEELGAVPVTIAVPDIYTGLERGTFDGLGFPPSAIEGWSWERFLNYRLDPGFMQSDLGIYVNPDKWASLSQEARTIITETAVEFEARSYERWQQLTADVNARFEEQGMQVIRLEGRARKAFLDTALGSAWARLEASGSPHYEELRRLHYSDTGL